MYILDVLSSHPQTKIYSKYLIFIKNYSKKVIIGKKKRVGKYNFFV